MLIKEKMEISIKIEGLCKTFKGKKGNRVEALKNINLEIYKGEVFGFLGPNGAGKTTTIKILMGLLFPTSGRFYINGVKGSSNDYKKIVGYLPENPAFFDYLTGEEFLRFVGNLYEMNESDINEKVESLLKTLDLYEARNRYIRSYSKGMVQRLGIAQCLLHDPDIYILDEPMSGLDPLGRILIRDIILHLRSKGKCVFMSTHILNDIETICDRVGIIVSGELKLVDSINNIMQRGLKGYLISFNKVSDSVADYLSVKAEKKDLKTDTIVYQIRPCDIDELLSMVACDEMTSIQLIEPVRKGLEELFKEIMIEDNTFKSYEG